ncbi:dihydromonapterin reductase [Marinomonas mediterranea]|jgi:Dehydrogenases with different specificities (related to short-chain alcohol dehydrogenases)|uniref:Dihydromonapterin reductase n=1 Tax=Marinomonas mediterranea (strain ATCC 700492 / JCM 21426 / NBRC 103028 / MMB-1) TaxID=717774 RepID=F2JVP3_MARM1|nr:dihydromonapterin reductase [Marinomonas mediterranea]ADZ90587.1 Dihydrofolate reductase [Marinomonas mediterranea MMB-1]WCN08633.1 dihydromonapterin reductase [Marinomonas mediterranea]WCN12687.1 dihydromonapterin reductase [Marinomonas mediterranea]WCN16761.1 dihydromonapterin reductase [Marinomonas mediterranea MMB-1]
MREKLPILVTGGTQRLGLAIVHALLRNGYELIVTYRTPKASVDELRKMGVRCIRSDFENANCIAELVETITQDCQGLRAIIHNASDWQAEDEVSYSALIERMFKIHVNAPYELNMAFSELLKHAACSGEDQSADIIHFTDYVAEKGSDKHIAYSSSKAALANLTLSFAKKLSPHVKVNSIAPSLLKFNDKDDEEYRAKALAKSLMQIEPGEQEAVAAVEYILSSRYMTGRTIALDGGRHLA